MTFYDNLWSFVAKLPTWPQTCGMMQADRIVAILEMLQQRGSCTISALASSFAVSEETIRRDLRQLQSTGRVIKVHGGVMLPDNRLEAPYNARLRENAAAKKAIANTAAGQIEDGMTIFVDSGTTSFWVARATRRFRRLTIVTHSLEVANEVAGHDDHRVFFAGGAINTDYKAAFDNDAITYCQKFVFDIAIMSIAAIDARHGFLDVDPDEGAFKRALIGCPRSTLMVADQTKFGRSGNVRVAHFQDVNALYTDAPAPPDIAQAAMSCGTQIHVVEGV